jgi:DNA-directed RNA polymerase subunit M/transcription elongation factor TFIIS
VGDNVHKTSRYVNSGTISTADRSNTFGGDDTTNHFYCLTCSYTCSIASDDERGHTKRVSIVSQLPSTSSNKRRMMMGNPNSNDHTDLDILGGKSAWENVDRTSAICPKCQHHEAYFVQIQIRSADEPMTIFYKCCQCTFQWNE